MNVNPQDLMGLTELARLFGVTKQVVGNWVNRYRDFPYPVVELGCGRIWLRPDIEKWKKEHGK